MRFRLVLVALLLTACVGEPNDEIVIDMSIDTTTTTTLPPVNPDLAYCHGFSDALVTMYLKQDPTLEPPDQASYDRSVQLCLDNLEYEYPYEG